MDSDLLEFNLTPDIAELFSALARIYPNYAKKWVARLLNDEAFDFRDRVLPVIGSRYIVRSPAFLKSAFRVVKADTAADINRQCAVVDINNEKEKKNFSAWTEELTGEAPRRTWSYTKLARSGMKENKVMKRYIDRSHTAAGSGGGGEAYPDSFQHDGGEYAALRMIHAFVTGKEAPASASRAFLIRDGQRDSRGGTFGEGLYTLLNGKVRMISKHNKPPAPPQWDWLGTVRKEALAKYTGDYIFKNYVREGVTEAANRSLKRRGLT
jgi:hypothetical protein